MIGKNYTVFLADTTINERPTSEDLAHIAERDGGSRTPAGA